MNDGERQHMRSQPRWHVTGLFPAVIGSIWLVAGWNSGLAAGLIASVPGIVLTGAGATLVLWPGERFVVHYLALCAAASVVLALAMSWTLGAGVTVVLVFGAAACCLLSGFVALRQNPLPVAVPPPPHDLVMASKVALDEGFLAFFVACSKIPYGEAVTRDIKNLELLATLAEKHQWADDPGQLHRQPQVPKDAMLKACKEHGESFDWLAFDSNYIPMDGTPETDAWLAQRANTRVHARIFEHPGGARPWLLCLHGYRMGTAMSDFSLFNINHLHEDLGLNLLMPILPLHGPRRQTWLSGGGFFDGSLVRMFHAEVQTLWDVRRCLAWLRAEREVPAVGTLGYSLGGYNAALLAAVQPDLACVIAGIPLTSIPAIAWRNLSTIDRRYMSACGLGPAWMEHVMRPISPLHWAPRVAHDRRFVFAAAGDQIVPPEQPLALWRHWQEPAMYWYPGSHISVRHEKGAAAFIDDALDHGLASQLA